MLFAQCASAVIIVDDAGTTVAPTFAPSSLWANTLSSSVYIGNGWYLTAKHAVASGPNVHVLMTVWDTAVGGDGVTEIPSDLAVISGADTGPVDFTLSCSTPTIDTEVLFIADGISRSPGAATNQLHFDSAWTSVPSGDPSTMYSGYATGGSAIKRWGTNTVSDDGYFILGPSPANGIAPNNLTAGIGTTFDESTTGTEAQVDFGDSGGAMFVQTANGWELAGIISGKGPGMVTGQPNDVAIFGNESAMSDIAFYHSQIENITGISACATAVPEPSPALLLLAIGLPVGFVRWRQRCLRFL